MKTRKHIKFAVSFVVCGSLMSGINTASAAPFSQNKPTGAVSGPDAQNPQNSMWTSISNDFGMDHDIDRPEVQTQIAILQKNQAALYRTLNAAAPYISYVFQQVHKAGLPGELALLPIVESQYDPMAKSQVGASGVWQIMPNTAPELGLKNNQAYDGRRDIVASTDGALRYLKQLSNAFNDDWHLALAAYNFGPGNIRKAKRKSKADQKGLFWVLSLPKETKDYVPKLMALAAIIKNPAKYNIRLPVISTGPKLATVQLAANQDLKAVAKANGISVQTMQQLNPGYHKLATTPGAPNKILLPVDKSATPQPQQPVLAANTVTAPTAEFAQIPAVEKSKSSSTTLLDTIIKQGKWLMLGFANVPSVTELNNVIADV